MRLPSADNDIPHVCNPNTFCWIFLYSSPTMYVHPACISAWGGLYTIQAVAFDLLIAFSLLFPQHTASALPPFQL
jgi:hypothetical protein